MATTQNNPGSQDVYAAQATVQDDLATPGATNIGTSPLTAVPGPGAAQDSVRPVGVVPPPEMGEAPQAAEESTRDDVAQTSTRAQLKAPSRFGVLWSNN